MLQSTPQLSPRQLLEAGHRAESEGKIDLAFQFYSQVADHFDFAPEADPARHRLARLRAGAQLWHHDGPNHHQEIHHTQASHRPSRRPKYPAPRDHYRAGRVVARLCSGAGWLIVVVGIAVTPAYLLASSSIPFGLASVLGTASGLVLFGLFVLALGQAARALFDQANATRELVAIERAKASQAS
jgi:hypothetical protein